MGARIRRTFGIANFSYAGRTALDLDVLTAAILRDLEAMRPTHFSGNLNLFLDFAPQLGVRDVPDPYDEGPEGFELTLDLIERGSEALAATLAQKLGK